MQKVGFLMTRIIYINMPMQYTAIVSAVKMTILDKNLGYVYYFCWIWGTRKNHLNIYEYSLFFFDKSEENNSYPFQPHFYRMI